MIYQSSMYRCLEIVLIFIMIHFKLLDIKVECLLFTTKNSDKERKLRRIFLLVRFFHGH